MLTAVVGVGIQNPHRRTVGSQLLTSLIIIFKLKGSLSVSHLLCPSNSDIVNLFVAKTRSPNQ
jgi:hypothetical protein